MAWTELSSAARAGPKLGTTNTSNPMALNAPESQNPCRVGRMVNHDPGLEVFRLNVFFIDSACVAIRIPRILHQVSRRLRASQGILISRNTDQHVVTLAEWEGCCPER